MKRLHVRKMLVLLYVVGLTSALVNLAGAVSYPKPDLTPGVVDPAATKEMVCKVGYTAKVRLVTEATKQAVFKKYGVPYVRGKMGAWEIDHFISLEIGGKNDIMNLWPQPIKEARLKDQYVEDELHCLVCNGKITLQDAQETIRKDWYAYYQKVVADKANRCKR